MRGLRQRELESPASNLETRDRALERISSGDTAMTGSSPATTSDWLGGLPTDDQEVTITPRENSKRVGTVAIDGASAVLTNNRTDTQQIAKIALLPRKQEEV